MAYENLTYGSFPFFDRMLARDIVKASERFYEDKSILLSKEGANSFMTEIEAFYDNELKIIGLFHDELQR